MLMVFWVGMLCDLEGRYHVKRNVYTVSICNEKLAHLSYFELPLSPRVDTSNGETTLIVHPHGLASPLSESLWVS
jgi:hypothetical protein